MNQPPSPDQPRKTYRDLTDEQLVELHGIQFPWIKDRVIKANRERQNDTTDSYIETRSPSSDFEITWWIEDGGVEISKPGFDTCSGGTGYEGAIEVWRIVAKCKEFGLTY